MIAVIVGRDQVIELGYACILGGRDDPLGIAEAAAPPLPVSISSDSPLGVRTV